jgi:hypothetical protein
MILEETDKIARDGVHIRASRGVGMESANGHLHCIVKFYVDKESPEKDVYQISAGEIRRNGAMILESRVELLGTDSADEYWDKMLTRDKVAGNAIVTPDHRHYTVSPDSPVPGWGDGHGGREFVFEVDVTTAHRLQAIGLNVKQSPLFQATWLLTSRNVWSQDRIPKKHWDKFPPNAVHKR